MEMMTQLKQAQQDGEKSIEYHPTWVRGYQRAATAYKMTILWGIKTIEQAAAVVGLDAYPTLDQMNELQRWFETWVEKAGNSSEAKEGLTLTQQWVNQLVEWERLKGKWSGTVAEALGGYPQQYNFTQPHFGVDSEMIKGKVAQPVCA